MSNLDCILCVFVKYLHKELKFGSDLRDAAQIRGTEKVIAGRIYVNTKTFLHAGCVRQAAGASVDVLASPSSFAKGSGGSKACVSPAGAGHWVHGSSSACAKVGAAPAPWHWSWWLRS